MWPAGLDQRDMWPWHNVLYDPISCSGKSVYACSTAYTFLYPVCWDCCCPRVGQGRALGGANPPHTSVTDDADGHASSETGQPASEPSSQMCVAIEQHVRRVDCAMMHHSKVTTLHTCHRLSRPTTDPDVPLCDIQQHDC